MYVYNNYTSTESDFNVYQKRLDNVLAILATLDDNTWAKWYWNKVFNELHRRMNTMYRSDYDRYKTSDA